MAILRETLLAEYVSTQNVERSVMENNDLAGLKKGFPPLPADDKSLLKWCGRFGSVKELFELWSDSAKVLLEQRNRQRYNIEPAEDFALRFLTYHYGRVWEKNGRDKSEVKRLLFGADRPEWIIHEIEQMKLYEMRVKAIATDCSAWMPTIEWLLRNGGKVPPYKPDDFQVVLDWLISPVPELAADLERKDWLQMKDRFARKLEWVDTGDLYVPWRCGNVDGQTWEVRLNDFPDRLPFTLLIDGRETGTFLVWPTKSWKRQVRKATFEHPAAHVPPPLPPQNINSSDWVNRYKAGQFAEVWAEMESIGERIQQEPYRGPGVEVARETVERIHKNLTLVVGRLEEEGYKFGVRGLKLEILGKPKKADREALSDLREDGPLPLILDAWYEKFGAVNLTGRHKSLAFVAKSMFVFEDEEDIPLVDPLVVLPLARSIEDSEAPGELEISWSPEIKAGIGGGDGMSVALRPATADPKFVGFEDLTFLSYLRSAILNYAGFPGWKHHPAQAPMELIGKLKQDLISF